jgi:hypothetical protein
VYCSPFQYINSKRQKAKGNTTKRNKKELRAIMAEFVDDKKWNERYEQLVEFKRNTGSCLVPQRYQENASLGTWVNTQRQLHANNTVRLDRKELLEELGFAWKAQGANADKIWHTQYEKLAEFKRNTGSCLVPSRYEEDISLGIWVVNQRQSHSKNKLRLDRKGLLDDIGFVWRVDNSAPPPCAWNKQYEKLVEFRRKNGHCLVPQRYQEDISFGKWVVNQRQSHSKNKLRLDRKGLLDELEFVWRVDLSSPSCARACAWNKQYEKLVEFKQKNGHCAVPCRYEEDMSFGKWVSYQRQKHIKNKIRLDQKELLDELGFVWRVGNYAPSCAWNKQYEKLVECQQKNGHYLVPRGSEKDTSLEIWVRKQQVRLVDNKMRPDNKDNEWRTHYEKLVEFRRKNGHCIVPQGYEEDISLGKWVVNQRQSHSKNKLRLDRKVLLDELEFVWIVDLSAPWKKLYEQLVEFKRKNGHCIVAVKGWKGADDKALGNWVSGQRARHADNKMRQDQKELLDELGFVWNVEDHLQYEKLVALKRQHVDEIVWKADTLADPSSTTDVSRRHWITSRFIQDSSVGLPDETLEETEPGQGHGRHRFACPSPNIKRPRSCLAESQQMAATTNPRGGASGRSSVEKDGGHDEEDSKPSLVNSSSVLVVASYPDQEVVQEHTHYEIPSGWKRVKLEPDC